MTGRKLLLRQFTQSSILHQPRWRQESQEHSSSRSSEVRKGKSLTRGNPLYREVPFKGKSLTQGDLIPLLKGMRAPSGSAPAPSRRPSGQTSREAPTARALLSFIDINIHTNNNNNNSNDIMMMIKITIIVIIIIISIIIIEGPRQKFIHIHQQMITVSICIHLYIVYICVYLSIYLSIDLSIYLCEVHVLRQRAILVYVADSYILICYLSIWSMCCAGGARMKKCELRSFDARACCAALLV